MIDFVLSDLRRVAEDFWPAGTAESWDRVGLVAGRNEAPLRRVLLAVDAVNAAPEYIVGKKLVAAQARVAPGELVDKSISMKDIGARALG